MYSPVPSTAPVAPKPGALHADRLDLAVAENRDGLLEHVDVYAARGGEVLGLLEHPIGELVDDLLRHLLALDGLLRSLVVLEILRVDGRRRRRGRGPSSRSSSRGEA